MGELIAAFVEAMVGLFVAFLEAVPLILEALLYLVAAAVTFIAYALSRRFREAKRSHWASQPRKKYLELGFSAACLGLLIAVVGWLAWPSPNRAGAQAGVAPGPGTSEMRLKVTTTAAGGATNEISVAVKKGGTRKILETRSVAELRKAIRENVTVVRRENETRGELSEVPPLR